MNKKKSFRNSVSKKKKLPKISSPHTHSKFRTNPSPIASFHSHSPLRSPIISPHNQISLTDLRRRRESLFLTSSSPSPSPSPSSPSSLKAMAQRPQLLYRTLLKVQKIAFAGDPKAVSCMCARFFSSFLSGKLGRPPSLMLNMSCTLSLCHIICITVARVRTRGEFEKNSGVTDSKKIQEVFSLFFFPFKSMLNSLLVCL